MWHNEQESEMETLKFKGKNPHITQLKKQDQCISKPNKQDH